MTIKSGLFAFLIIAMAWGLTTQVGYAVNATHSLPQTLFVVHQKALPKRNQHISFTASEQSKFPGRNLTKIVKGVPGDEVTVQGQAIFINGNYIATAKTLSQDGQPLAPIRQGTIPKAHYFVWTPHKDSYDSRYQSLGLIHEKDIVGVAYPVW